MSLWWAKKNQLDPDQVELIETLSLTENHLVLGPPGSGKTNVLLRRAQYVRGQDQPNVLVLTFTRSLTEFVKTGCFDDQGREFFPASCVTTLEAWLRAMYEQHDKPLPRRSPTSDLVAWKKSLAAGASAFRKQGLVPRYDVLFVDEAQDLLPEEAELLAEWGRTVFLVGDDRQKIYDGSGGLDALRGAIPSLQEHNLRFHYRLAPEICRAADRILSSVSGESLEDTCHYTGPTPGRVEPPAGPMSEDLQIEQVIRTLKDQLRVYGDLIRQGDRLGVVVALKADRERMFQMLEADPALQGKSKIIRARNGDEDDDYDPSFDAATPITILTAAGCKGLEFRAVHWVFAEKNKYHFNNEHYYTVVTRAKTSLHVYYTELLPQALARACPQTVLEW